MGSMHFISQEQHTYVFYDECILFSCTTYRLLYVDVIYAFDIWQIQLVIGACSHMRTIVIYKTVLPKMHSNSTCTCISAMPIPCTVYIQPVCTSSNWGTTACTQMENRAAGHIKCTMQFYMLVDARHCGGGHMLTCTHAQILICRCVHIHMQAHYTAPRIHIHCLFLATWSHICTCICARRDCDRCSYKHMHRENKSVPIYTYVHLQFEMKSQHCARVMKWLYLDVATIYI